MPYIEHPFTVLVQWPAVIEKGDLTFALTRVVTQYCDDKGLSYSTINDILGALDGASKEFYRRVAAPYEDKKMQENGDVYAPSD